MTKTKTLRAARGELPENTAYINGYLRRFITSFSTLTPENDPLPQFLDEARRTGKKYYAQRVYAQLAHGFDGLSDAERAVLRYALHQLARGVPASKAFMVADQHRRGATRERNRVPTDKTLRDDELAELVDAELEKMKKNGIRRLAITVASSHAAQKAKADQMHVRFWGQSRPVAWRTFYDAYRKRKTIK